jgi:DNA-binding CsgD family transcriptional regulator
VLLGRERERQALDRLLATARSGRSAVLALVGEPGIGKTLLLSYAAEQAGSLRVLRARGIESESQVPFAALFELLRPTLHLLERIPPPQAAALEGALALRPSMGRDRFAVSAGTLSLLAAYADESPVLVLVDDAHLLDASSAEALRFALRRLLAEPLGAVLAVRDGEASLLDGADLPTMFIGALDRDSAAALLGSVQAEFAQRLYRATGGNPLALLELRDDAVHLASTPIDSPLPAPERVARAFARRADVLEDPVRRLLVLVAASDSGEVSTLEPAATSLGLDFADLAGAEKTGLLRLSEGRVEFSHPLARAAIYGEAAPDLRRQAHRALAGALPDRDADRRAWHLAEATVGTDANVASALEQAGGRARSRSAYAVAAAAFERAARLTAGDQERGRLLFAAADAAWLAGLADRAIALLAEARALAPARAQLIDIEHLRGRIATRRGPVMQGHAILIAAAELAAETDPDLAVTILAEAADACFFAGDAREMQRSAERARALLRANASTRARFLASITEGMASIFVGAGKGGVEAIREAVSLAERSERLREDEQLLPWLVMGPLWLRETEAGRALVEAAIDSARAEAALSVLPWLLNRIARSHAATDSWTAADVEYAEATQLALETGQRTELAAALAGRAWLEARQGREADCRAHAAEARELCRELGIGLYETWAIRARAELELGLGRPDAAAHHFEQLAQRLRELGIADVDLSPAAELVDAYLRLGRREDASARAAALDSAAQDKGQPWSLARAARCRGSLATDQAFERDFREALRLHAQTPDVFEAACTHLAYGARLRRERQRMRAREELRAALEIFERLGARPWAALAHTEIVASGETARRRDPSTLDELTHQELHIAQLLASGRTTREAAASLFLSPKTIEYHLRSVYRKLGVKSRGELAKALGSS